MPRAVVITKLDHARADYDGTPGRRAGCVRRQGATAVSAGGRDTAPDSSACCRRRTSCIPTAPARLRDPDASDAERIEEQRGTLIEGIIEESEDESLMERYLGGEEIDQAVLIEDLEKAVARGSFFPVIPVCSGTGVGTLELLEVATSGFPSPLEHPLPEVFTPQGAPHTGLGCDPAGPLARRGGQDDVGSLRRQGQPGPGVLRHHQARRDRARVGPFFVVLRRRPSASASHRSRRPRRRRTHRHRCRSRWASSSGRRGTVVAGDICAIGRLTRAETGDTLSDKSDPLVLKPWSMPEPLLPVAVQAHAKTDEDKLSVGLQRLAAEDPTLRIEQNQETHQIVLWCMGEAHAGVVLDALANRFGVTRRHHRTARAAARNVRRQGKRPRPPRQAVRRARPVRGLRHRGRAAAGGLAVSSSSTRSSAVRCRASSFPASRRACARRWRRVWTLGYPLVDIRVTLLDGKAHSVDSSDFAFQMAGALALREAAAAAEGQPARAGGRGLRGGARRSRRRGDERPVGSARPGAGHRQRRAATAPWCGPRCLRWS